jgi:hypothetical protein
MAYIQISSDGQRPVGPLGLKKAEQDLIKRRYKHYAPHHQNDGLPPQVSQKSLNRLQNLYGHHYMSQPRDNYAQRNIYAP